MLKVVHGTGKPIAELHGITCHMGSCSVIFSPNQTDRYSITFLRGMEG